VALLMSGGFWFWLKNKRAAPRREIFKFFFIKGALVGPKEKEAGVGGWGSLVSLFFWPREGTVAGDSGEKIANT
jgi:hypothetical protein